MVDYINVWSFWTQANKLATIWKLEFKHIGWILLVRHDLFDWWISLNLSRFMSLYVCWWNWEWFYDYFIWSIDILDWKTLDLLDLFDVVFWLLSVIFLCRKNAKYMFILQYLLSLRVVFPNRDINFVVWPKMTLDDCLK